MPADNVYDFPGPDEGLAFEDRMTEVARLAEKIADTLGADGLQLRPREIIARLETAAVDLQAIGELLLRGTERVRMDTTCANVLRTAEQALEAWDKADAARQS